MEGLGSCRWDWKQWGSVSPAGTGHKQQTINQYSFDQERTFKLSRTLSTSLYYHWRVLVKINQKSFLPNIPSGSSNGCFTEVLFFSAAPYGNYWVLDTDYDTYTLIYSCTNILGISHFEFGWILARTRTLPDETIQKLFGIMEGFHINTHHFLKTDQSGC